MQLSSSVRPVNASLVKNIIEHICHDLASPVGRNLQERCLESMVLMERFRGIGTIDDIVPATADADISPTEISRLADCLSDFIVSHPHHPDVGSATWALGKLRDPKFVPVFERVLATNSGYSDHTRHQAVVSLQDIGHDPQGAEHGAAL